MTSWVAFGCGGRTTLDDIVYVEVDASVSSDGALDAAKKAPVDAAEEPSVFSCAGCVVGSCGPKVLACVEDTGCQQTLTCVAQECLEGGTPDVGCIFTCSGQDPASLAELLGILQCVTGTCGADCSSTLGGVLGGLGGLSGLGG